MLYLISVNHFISYLKEILSEGLNKQHVAEYLQKMMTNSTIITHIGLCYLNIFIKYTLAKTIGILINSKLCRIFAKTLTRRKLDYMYQ